MRIAAVTLVLGLIGVATAHADEAWLTFHDPAAMFVFQAPIAPVADQDSTQGPDGKAIPLITYTVDLGSAGYLVEAADMTGYNADPARFIDAGASAAESLAAKTISDTVVQLDGQTGREVVMDGKDGNRIVDRIYFLKGHVYQVMSVIAPDATSAQDADAHRFLDSFHFTGG